MAIAADPEAYRSLAAAVGMSDDEQRKSADYGSEVHRSWRRVLRPLWMPEGVASNEVRIKLDSSDIEGEIVDGLRASGVTQEIEAIVRRFDWHSQVTVAFRAGEGGAGWSRSKRTITVHGEYMQRFVNQGESVARQGADEEGAR